MARSISLCLRLHPRSIKQPEVLGYLRALQLYLSGHKAILLRDRLPAHRGGKVQKYIRKKASGFTMDYLPPYAPKTLPCVVFLGASVKNRSRQFRW